jgi:TctA family transporter
MFEKLKAKWKVNGTQFFLIMCTFAVTGTLTAYISRYITTWVGFTDQTFWVLKFLLRLVVLVFGYQVIILIVSFFFGQFPFFWAYEKKILRWLFGTKSQKSKVKSQNSSELTS